MVFDRNQTEFDSEYQKAVHSKAVNIIPLEISLENVTDAAERDDFAAFHGFVIDAFTELYENPEIISDAGVSVHDFYNPHKRRDVIFSKLMSGVLDEKHGKLTETYKKLCDAAKKYKVNMCEYVETCDFRIFRKGFARTFEDLVRPLPDALQAGLTVLHEYALKAGCKVEKSVYWNRARYKYKGFHVMSIGLEGNGINIGISVTHKGSIHDYPCENNDRLIRFLEGVTQHDNAEELKAYLLKGHIAYCKWCTRSLNRPRCGVWQDVFGNKRMLCNGPGISSCNTKGDDCGIDERVVNIFKQFVDIKIGVIDKEIAGI